MATIVNKLQNVTTAVAAMAMVTFVCLSCDHQQQTAKKQTEADSIIMAAYDGRDYECAIALCDSLEQAGDISKIRAALFRGNAYFQLGKMKPAEDEYKKAMAETPKNETDSLCFYQIACKLSEIYNVSRNDDGVLQLALPKIEELNVWAEKKPSEQIFKYLQILTINVGQTQLRLGMKKEAEKMYESYFSYIDKQNSIYQTSLYTYNNVVGINNIIVSFINAEQYTTAEKFLPRLDSLASKITAIQDSTAGIDVDDVLSSDYLLHAFIDNSLNRPKEAARYLSLYQNTQRAKTLAGRFNEGELLMKMKRYAEAADAYAVLDNLFAQYNKELSLDNILNYGRKFEANYKAGRRDTALAVAAFVFENLDSAITKQKNSDAAELATIYQTQQKDAEIAQQQLSLSRQRWIGTLVALALLTTFFIIYTLYRRRAQKRLAIAHEKLETAHTELQTAYDQLETTTAAKERIESELRIARDIQMSMVPGVFPERKGLDMYAEMNPAKEVGGDLYGYVMQGDVLYFCVGDVSGKGVPASLFMAQSARLFRTLAAEGMMPAVIATRMNNELVDGNDSNMFVTMFLGMLHLDTGRLDFCNCGHNAPVYDGRFLEMKHVNQMIGILEDCPFYGETIDDIRGHQLLIYTDGLNEAENQQKELLGNERLLELMADTQGLDSHQVIDMLKEAVEEHRAGAEPNDDLTLMCIDLALT
jgi:serine phosphatase RsbU (regulator of sigma subunit)